MIYVYSDCKSLRQTSEELLNSAIWNDSEIIDSNAIKYTILEVRKVGLRGLWGWHPLLKGKSIWVDFIFSEGEEIDIENLKKTLISKVNMKKHFWESGWDIHELKEKIKVETSMKNIILYFN